MKKTPVFLIVLISIIAIGIRLYFLFKPGYANDIQAFLEWGGRINKDGFWSLYGGDFYKTNGIDYPFLIPLITSLWLNIGSSIKDPEAIKTFFKVLPTLGEIALILVSSFAVYHSKAKYKWWLIILIILSPGLALVSSAWGQVDSIMTLFILLGFIFERKNKYIATTFFFLSLITKPQAAIAVFIYYLYLLSKKKYQDFFKQFFFMMILMSVFYAIFFYLGQSNFFSTYINSVGRYKYLSLYAFNLWWLLKGMKCWYIMDDAGAVISHKTAGLILFTLFEVPAIIYIFKKTRTLAEILLVTAYSYLVFFIFPTEMHERYLYIGVALMAVPAILNKKILLIYVLLSITFLINIFLVLQTTFPQFEFFQGNLMGELFTRSVSFVNVATVIYLMLYLYYDGFKKSV